MLHEALATYLEKVGGPFSGAAVPMLNATWKK